MLLTVHRHRGLRPAPTATSVATTTNGGWSRGQAEPPVHRRTGRGNRDFSDLVLHLVALISVKTSMAGGRGWGRRMLGRLGAWLRHRATSRSFSWQKLTECPCEVARCCA